MLLNKIVLSKTPPTSPNTVWAKPSNGGVSLYTYSNNKWGPIQSMDDMGTDNPDDDQPGKVITQELFDETIQDLKDYVSENYASNIKVLITTPPATLNAQVGYYYCMGGNGVVVDTMTIQLPAIADKNKTKNVQFFMTMGSAPAVTFVSAGAERIRYQKDFALEAERGYEVNALWNGYAWVITVVEIVVPPMNIITYEASAKLTETTDEYSQGLHTYAFSGKNGQLAITSHTFENGIGSIEFNGDVISIGNRAFSECSSLTSITIPSSVTNIDGFAFAGCSSLTSITIPNSVTSIGERAFQGCSTLTSIYIPDSVTSIGEETFSECSSLTSITIPDSVTSIGEYAFYGCTGLTNITIPDSVISIGGETFQGCTSLTSITIPDSVTSIGNGAFRSCTGLTSITIGSNVTSIGEQAFQSCSSLTSITIPNSVTSIGYAVFNGCSSLTSVTIPNSVTSIGDNAFQDCSVLTSVTIGSGVTSIGSSVFYNCSKLTSITSLATTAPTIKNNTFQNVKAGGTLTVPSGSTGYDVWMGTGNYYLGKYNWTKVEQ